MKACHTHCLTKSPQPPWEIRGCSHFTDEKTLRLRSQTQAQVCPRPRIRALSCLSSREEGGRASHHLSATSPCTILGAKRQARQRHGEGRHGGGGSPGSWVVSIGDSVYSGDSRGISAGLGRSQEPRGLGGQKAGSLPPDVMMTGTGRRSDTGLMASERPVQL